MSEALHKKYPKWSLRRAAYRRRRKRRKRRKRATKSTGSSNTEVLLVNLLQRLLHPVTLAKKHGENVITGHGGVVKPGLLSTAWSELERRRIVGDPAGPGAGAGAGAAAAIGGRRSRPASPRR